MATNALRQMQGFPFFEKKMRIQFAKVGVPIYEGTSKVDWRGAVCLSAVHKCVEYRHSYLLR